MRLTVLAVTSLAIGACAPLKDLAVIPGLADAFTKQVEVAPAFFQSVANDYFVASEQYRFLTNRTCDSLGTPGIRDFLKIPLTRKQKNGKITTITYAEYEQERLAVKSKALEFLTKYAGQMRERAKAAESFSAGINFVSSTADIAASVPVFGATAAPYTSAAKGILSVLDRFQNDASAIAIVHIAMQAKPDLDKMINQIKVDYGVINVDAKIYVTAWSECTVARISAMRTPLAGVTLPSAAEVDAVYSTYLQKAVEYQKSIPSVEDELDAISRANTKIANNDFTSVLTAAQEMVGAATAAYNAIQAVQRLN